jgi:hypothetical protein
MTTFETLITVTEAIAAMPDNSHAKKEEGDAPLNAAPDAPPDAMEEDAPNPPSQNEGDQGGGGDCDMDAIPDGDDDVIVVDDDDDKDDDASSSSSSSSDMEMMDGPAAARVHTVPVAKPAPPVDAKAAMARNKQTSLVTNLVNCAARGKPIVTRDDERSPNDPAYWSTQLDPAVGKYVDYWLGREIEEGDFEGGKVVYMGRKLKTETISSYEIAMRHLCWIKMPGKITLEHVDIEVDNVVPALYVETNSVARDSFKAGIFTKFGSRASEDYSCKVPIGAVLNCKNCILVGHTSIPLIPWSKYVKKVKAKIDHATDRAEMIRCLRKWTLPSGDPDTTPRVRVVPDAAGPRMFPDIKSVTGKHVLTSDDAFRVYKHTARLDDDKDHESTFAPGVPADAVLGVVFHGCKLHDVCKDFEAATVRNAVVGVADRTPEEIDLMGRSTEFATALMLREDNAKKEGMERQAAMMKSLKETGEVDTDQMAKCVQMSRLRMYIDPHTRAPLYKRQRAPGTPSIADMLIKFDKAEHEIGGRDKKIVGRGISEDESKRAIAAASFDDFDYSAVWTPIKKYKAAAAAAAAAVTVAVPEAAPVPKKKPVTSLDTSAAAAGVIGKPKQSLIFPFGAQPPAGEASDEEKEEEEKEEEEKEEKEKEEKEKEEEKEEKEEEKEKKKQPVDDKTMDSDDDHGTTDKAKDEELRDLFEAGGSSSGSEQAPAKPAAKGKAAAKGKTAEPPRKLVRQTAFAALTKPKVRAPAKAKANAKANANAKAKVDESESEQADDDDDDDESGSEGAAAPTPVTAIVTDADVDAARKKTEEAEALIEGVNHQIEEIKREVIDIKRAEAAARNKTAAMAKKLEEYMAEHAQYEEALKDKVTARLKLEDIDRLKQQELTTLTKAYANAENEYDQLSKARAAARKTATAKPAGKASPGKPPAKKRAASDAEAEADASKPTGPPAKKVKLVATDGALALRKYISGVIEDKCAQYGVAALMKLHAEVKRKQLIPKGNLRLYKASGKKASDNVYASEDKDKLVLAATYLTLYDDAILPEQNPDALGSATSYLHIIREFIIANADVFTAENNQLEQFEEHLDDESVTGILDDLGTVVAYIKCAYEDHLAKVAASSVAKTSPPATEAKAKFVPKLTFPGFK